MEQTFGGLVSDSASELKLRATPERSRMVSTMKALVFGGTGKIELKKVQLPSITRDTDAIVRIVKTTICGTDLGIMNGKVPTVQPGTILGHEGVGIIEETGSSVRNFKKGTM